jgi:hypothetical protein
MEERRTTCENLKGRSYGKTLGVGKMIILKWILLK